MRTALVVLLLVLPAWAGCVDQGTPRLTARVDKDEVRWGDAAQVTLINAGDGPVQPPVRVEIVSANGTVVRTYPDVTNGRGIPVNGQVSVAWNGLDDEERPVLWGRYTLNVAGTSVRASVELLRPPHYAITVDPIPATAPAGSRMEFRVNNTGTTWVNGTLQVTAGREETILYTAEAPVRLAPGQGYSFLWDGKDPRGRTPEAQKYLVAAQGDAEEGPRPFAQDVFTLT